jgi:hypothetical protein
MFQACQFHGVNYICLMVKGLSHKFTLNNGTLTFKQGQEKVKDDLHFFLLFNGVPRVYIPDYDPGLNWYIQKPASALEQFKVLILGNLKKKILLYVPKVNVESLSSYYDRAQKLNAVEVNFTYTSDPTITQQQVVFL